MSGRALPRRQAGIAIVLVTVAMLALIAVTGLALDMGHVFVNKTRLQNALDVSALSAAKELVITGGDMNAATAAARNTFALNQDQGNQELAGIASSDVDVEFSDTLMPWVPNSGANFVRVSVATFSLDAFLISVLGIDDKPVVASATAGPETADCVYPFPLLACGDDRPPEEGGPHDPDASPPNYYGYTIGEQVVLKYNSKGCDFADPTCEENGPGNFLVLDVGSGSRAVRDAMCGRGDRACVTAPTMMDTQPGGQTGPVAQGLNTRFGVYRGPVNAAECPADTNVDEYDPTGGPHYGAYVGGGPNGRRVVPIPVGECTEVGGKKKVNIYEHLCFLLVRKAEQAGNKQFVYGEFLDPKSASCLSKGEASPDPDATGGAVIIVLYKDQVMGDS